MHRWHSKRGGVMGAFMETKQLVREGVWIVGGVMVASVVMLGLIAWAHDGDVARVIIAQLIGVIQWGMPIVGVLLGVTTTAGAFVSVKTGENSTNTPPQAQPQPAPTLAPVAAVAPVAVPALAGDL